MPTPPRTSDPAVIEHRLLDLAYTTDSIITAPVLAYYVPCSIEDSDRVLGRLVAEERLRMEIDDDGNIHYEMPNRQRITPPRSSYSGALVRQSPQVIERHTPSAAAAAVLSLIVPGAGQLYAGRPVSAIAWFMIVSMGYLLLIVPGVLLHILCVASAAASAHTWRPSMA